MYQRLHFVFWSNWGQPGFMETKYYNCKFYSPQDTATTVLDTWVKSCHTKKNNNKKTANGSSKI